MHYDARITLYGGAVVSLSLIALGVATDPLLSATGVGFSGATLTIVMLFEHAATA